MNLPLESKERAKAILEDRLRERMNGVIAIMPVSWSIPDIAAVVVDHDEVSK